MIIRTLMNQLERFDVDRVVIVRVEKINEKGAPEGAAVFDVVGAHVLNSSSDEPLFCVLEIRERPEEVSA